jgi:hypothetical protein
VTGSTHLATIVAWLIADHFGWSGLTSVVHPAIIGIVSLAYFGLVILAYLCAADDERLPTAAVTVRADAVATVPQPLIQSRRRGSLCEAEGCHHESASASCSWSASLPCVIRCRQ